MGKHPFMEVGCGLLVQGPVACNKELQFYSKPKGKLLKNFLAGEQHHVIYFLKNITLASETLEKAKNGNEENSQKTGTLATTGSEGSLDKVIRVEMKSRGNL